MMFGFVDPESGLGILISVKILIMAALGGAGLLFGPLVGAAILVPLEEISNNLLGGKGAGLTFVVYGAIIVLIARFQPGGILTLINRLWASARQRRRKHRSRREPPMLLEARDITKTFGSFKAVDARIRDAGAGRYSRPDRAERRRQIHVLQLPDRRPATTSGKVLFEGQDITRFDAGGDARISGSPAPSRCRRPSRACRCWRT